jgi:hypothetical protein
MIHPIYQGKASVAITKFRGEYLERLDINSDFLQRNLENDVKALGKEYSVLAVYHNVNPIAYSGPIRRAINSLNLGKEIDLERILE